MTYLRATGRFLCVIFDLFSRKVISYKLSRKNDSMLALDTLAAAVQFENIHGFYNSVEPHSHNNSFSPDQVELFFLDHFLSTF